MAFVEFDVPKDKDVGILAVMCRTANNQSVKVEEVTSGGTTPIDSFVSSTPAGAHGAGLLGETTLSSAGPGTRKIRVTVLHGPTVPTTASPTRVHSEPGGASLCQVEATDTINNPDWEHSIIRFTWS